MEEGSFRCDANVSVMPKGSTVFGTRVELKNINSFRFVRHAIEYEIKRQVRLCETSERVVQETRLFDPAEGKTRSMRSKEEAHDYRYFPEPDLLPLTLDEALLDGIRKDLPELPRDRLLRFKSRYGLSHEDAKLLVADTDRAVGDLFEACAAKYRDARKLMNWFKGELFRAMKESEIRFDALRITPASFSALLTLVDDGRLSLSAAKEVFAELLEAGGDPAQIVAARGLSQVSDESAIESAVDAVISAHPDEVARYKAGKKQLFGFFTGQVMRSMKGKGNPAVVNELLKKKLGG
jgi:aspartyl-tRNA(Asn)/glutamyl-tRNA(Gln) amidotransferase subunit B